jgi:hypothetical protein
MNQESLSSSVDDILPNQIEALMRRGFIKAPNNFEFRITSQLQGVSQSSNVLADTPKNWSSRLAQICQWSAMTIGGALAALEVIAFVFGFWSASAAL